MSCLLVGVWYVSKLRQNSDIWGFKHIMVTRSRTQDRPLLPTTDSPPPRLAGPRSFGPPGLRGGSQAAARPPQGTNATSLYDHHYFYYHDYYYYYYYYYYCYYIITITMSLLLALLLLLLLLSSFGTAPRPGNECAFAHGDRDLRPLPDFYKTRLPASF